MSASKLRFNPLSGDWVLVSERRGKRPERPKECVFCSGNEHLTPPEILSLKSPFRDGWGVRVTPNKFNVLAIEDELQRIGVGIYLQENGVGAHEVIIDHPYADHRHPAEMKLEEIRMVFKAARLRMRDLVKDKRFVYPVFFKNHGEAAGASQDHPHWQLIVLPIVPKRVGLALDACLEYFQKNRSCLICRIINDEFEYFSRERIVLENESMVAWCPFGSRFPYEVCIAPKTGFHSHRFEDSGEEILGALAKALSETFKRVRAATKDASFNVVLFNSPWFENDVRPSHGATIQHDFHWFLQIIPRTTKIAGFELGSGFYINPKSPEDAAKELREVSIG